MDQPMDTGYPRELASQALKATGAKSNLKATEWILKQRRLADASRSRSSVQNGKGPASQSKMDHFFQGGNVASPTAQAHSYAISKAAIVPTDNALDLFPSALIEGDNNSLDSRAQQEPETGNDQGVTGSGTRAGFAGGFDGEIGGAHGWGSLNCSPVDMVRVEQEDLGSPGYGGPRRNAEQRFVSNSSLVVVPQRDDTGPGSSIVKFKRNQSQGGIQEDDGISGSKRFKQPCYTENNPAIPLPPLFSPQSGRPKQNIVGGSSARSRNNLAPLAERMRPTTIDEVLGQDHLLGPRQVLRKSLESDTVPSFILYGPPGIGKTSLARAIARSVPGLRFVNLSAVNSATKEVREIIEEAKRGKKYGNRTLLFLDEVHRFTKAQQDLFLPAVEAGHIVFIGATTENPSFEVVPALLSRCRILTLVKLQPEHLRKVLERAIGDRDKGVLASLPESFSTAGACEIDVEDDALNFLACAADGDARVALNAIEMATAAAFSEARDQCKAPTQDLGNTDVPRSSVLTRGGTLGTSSGIQRNEPAGLCTYGAERDPTRFGTMRLETLKENAKGKLQSPEDYTKPFKRFVGGKQVTQVHNGARFEREVVSLSGDGGNGVDGVDATQRKVTNPDSVVPEREPLNSSVPGAMVITVTLSQVQEAFQRSHVLYDKTGEEHYNIISALHKSMRGGDADAAIYWLARMLEGGEGPLYVARRLIRFASEDVGLADPNAMGMAVACYQACHFLGMPECNVNLAQCVVYLALAKKSVIVYEAIESAQKLVKETQHNDPVPLHLRNAPTKVMMDMGYGKGYIYPPGHVGPVEQEYMPPSLNGRKFLRWPTM